MIYQELLRSKKIKDPLFTSVRKYLEKQLVTIIAEGNKELITIAKQRYEGVKPTDIQIEPGVKFDNGKIRSCFVSRTRGFFHADALVETVGFGEVLQDHKVQINSQFTSVSILTAIKTTGLDNGVYNLSDTKEIVLVLDLSTSTIEEVCTLFGEIHWYEVGLTIQDSKDPITERSGNVLIRSINVNDKVVPIYYKPHLE